MWSLSLVAVIPKGMAGEDYVRGRYGMLAAVFSCQVNRHRLDSCVYEQNRRRLVRRFEMN